MVCNFPGVLERNTHLHKSNLLLLISANSNQQPGLLHTQPLPGWSVNAPRLFLLLSRCHLNSRRKTTALMSTDRVQNHTELHTSSFISFYFSVWILLSRPEMCENVVFFDDNVTGFKSARTKQTETSGVRMWADVHTISSISLHIVTFHPAALTGEKHRR